MKAAARPRWRAAAASTSPQKRITAPSLTPQEGPVGVRHNVVGPQGNFTTKVRHVTSDWSDEILISAANLEAYRLVYEAETWLRRIALTSLLLAEGPAWAGKIDSSLRGRLEAHSRINSSHWILGIDAEEELLWSATLGQLADILRYEIISARLSALTSTTGDVLAARIRSIADVRNALAHNRAISDDTLAVLNGDLVIIRAAARRFKARTLYAKSEIFLRSAPADLVSLAQAFSSVAERFPRQQLFLAANDDFVFCVRLPIEPFNRWPRADRLREILGQTAHIILCVLVNKTGDEFQFVFTRSLADTERLRALDRFAAAVAAYDLWTAVPPEQQHPADASWARLLYYETPRANGP
jgi:hypothetical protein